MDCGIPTNRVDCGIQDAGIESVFVTYFPHIPGFIGSVVLFALLSSHCPCLDRCPLRPFGFIHLGFIYHYVIFYFMFLLQHTLSRSFQSMLKWLATVQPPPSSSLFLSSRCCSSRRRRGWAKGHRKLIFLRLLLEVLHLPLAGLRRARPSSRASRGVWVQVDI